ncbi:MAG: carboxypeptidase regulatory-like domain-containing protein [Phycisphaerales bacterium]|nr:carboxypeptidase regulatory-like domain-containing protein [Phycisphaerales bacterium]
MRRSLTSIKMIHMIPFCSLLLLVGCSSGTIRGKVIAGDISIAVVVEEDDERLEAPGLAATDIRVVTADRGAPIAKVVSDENGEFSFPAAVPSDRLRVAARVDGYAPADQTFHYMQKSSRLLIILEKTVSSSGE